ncbi:CubicO group peptidase, beta-lactamase class C family [Marivirga sericea]|uniref:CubicO group peptidase, beta-lactamase class C family n=1 Tax=Marivirga sericea TaxID=1028 RepID=A0A1X7J3M8_9BACT|nr:serine hydrolase domain-containing protein [Marivirga sericea]SMG22023.1 CubicO group peptidase, beta-lactamase class C family [Marivirga sericea]
MKLFLNLLFLFVVVSANGQSIEISKILEEIDAQENLSGVVLVAQEGQIIYENTYGFANQTTNTPNNIDTKFFIGSLTKQFTALLVMQQLEAGKLALDAPIINYLPNYREDTGEKITIRHLLTHTHGIPNASDSANFSALTKEEFEKRYCQANLEFAPGTQFKYSNIIGYYLLGEIIEKVSSKEFSQLLEEKILKPLNLTNTGTYNPASSPKNLATGSLQNEGNFSNAPPVDMSFSLSAAGIFSTVEDLHKWDQAIRNEKLLSEDDFKQVFTPFSDSVRYGLGWYLNDPEINGVKHLLASHTGGAGGFKSQIMRGVEDDVLVVFLSNSDKYIELRYPLMNALLIKN